MFLLILTLTLCLTKAFVRENFEVTSPPDYSNDPIYNVNGWVAQLQLQRCALVAIGLKYFAIFVEDEILGDDHFKVRRKFFLGICQQEVLEEWNFCSPALAKRRKHKCRFKLKDDRYQPRVHRRFCDLKVLVNNRDCRCAPTIFGDPLMKVEGLPTCYIPPLPNTLCKYNVCGLNKCTPATVEDRIHTVDCSSSTCKPENLYCERPTNRSSRFLIPASFWSKWRRSGVGESPDPTASGGGGELSVATCINKRGKKGGLDCLGPGTGCCPKGVKNCTCQTYEENGSLKVERIIYKDKKERTRRSLASHCSHLLHILPGSNFFRFLRDTKPDDDNDLEDDDDDDDGDLDEDIVLEENPDDEKPIPTTEELEKEDAVEESNEEALEEIGNATDSSALEQKSNCQNVIFWGVYLRIVLVAGSVLMLNFTL